VGRTRGSPLAGDEFIGRQVLAGLDKALFVERDAAVQPFGAWGCSGHEEHVPDGASLDAAGSVVLPMYALHVPGPFESDKRCTRIERYLGNILKAPDEGSGHAF